MKNYLVFPFYFLFSLSVLGQQTLCEECRYLDSLYTRFSRKEFNRKCTISDTSIIDSMHYRVTISYLCEKKVMYSTYNNNDTIPMLNFILTNGFDTNFFITDKAPEFKGGRVEFARFIVRNIVYPRAAEKKRIEGKVYVEFIVKKDGNVEGVKLRKGIEASLDEEAIRVIKSTPKWITGEYNGKPVDFMLIQPINYRLPE